MVNNLRTLGKSEFERSNPPPTLSPNRSWNSIRFLGRRRKNPSHPVHHVVIITFTIPFFEVTFVEDLGHIAVPVTQVISILLHPCRSLRIIQPSSSTSAPCARPRARVVRVCVKKRRLRLAPAAKESATGVAMGSRSFVLIRSVSLRLNDRRARFYSAWPRQRDAGEIRGEDARRMARRPRKDEADVICRQPAATRRWKMLESFVKAIRNGGITRAKEESSV